MAQVRQTRIVAVVNQKGGVGKTTTAVNLAAEVAAQGRRVLLIDMDPQGHATLQLGLDPEEQELTVYDLLMNTDLPFTEIVRPSRYGVDVVPANIVLAQAEVELIGRMNRERALRRRLWATDPDTGQEQIADLPWDVVLIDCPPTLGLLTINALTAAHGVLVPLETAYFSVRGFGALLNTIETVRRETNRRLRLAGVVLTKYDKTNATHRTIAADASTSLAAMLIPTRISLWSTLDRGAMEGPVRAYAPHHPAVKAYATLAEEVLARV